MQFSKLLETRPSLFPIRIPFTFSNLLSHCATQAMTVCAHWCDSKRPQASCPPMPKLQSLPFPGNPTQGGSEVKGHCPGHHMDQQDHNLPYGRFQSQEKQHSSPALSTPHSSWPGFWSSLQIPKQKPKRILGRTCKLLLLLLSLARVSQ